MMNTEDEKQKRVMSEVALEVIKNYMKTSAFSDRKLTDTPTDALSVVNRKFVTLNGVSGSRPPAPVAGQFYFDTTLGYPIWWNGSAWVKSDGSAA